MNTIPVHTREQKLPFNQISWQHFEQLCLRLVRLDSSVEHTQSYGVQGDDQDGIDIYARHRENDLYSTYQCKNEKEFGPAKITEAVDVFLKGEWAKKSRKFVLCTRESMAPTARANAIEVQAKRLRKEKIEFPIWDEVELCLLLKKQPEIVDDFFGRSWVAAFCGDDEAAKLGDRITATQSEVALGAYYSWLSEKVGRVVYRGVANRDPGEKTIELPLERVYVEPMLVPEDERDARRGRERDIIRQLQDPDLDAEQSAGLEAEFRMLKMSDWSRLPVSWKRGWMMDVQPHPFPINPLALEDALGTDNRSVILGAPGSGKSTLLRWLALVCVRRRLHPEETSSLAVALDDALLLPILISLAAFANALQANRNTSLSDFIKSHLTSLGIEHLQRLFVSEWEKGACWILLDGVDEIADAKVRSDVVKAIETFLATLGNNRCLLTSRLHGYERVAGTTQFHIQAMDVQQAAQFIFQWNLVLEKELNPEDPNVERGRDNGMSLISQLTENQTLSTLASNPLLLVALLLMHRQNQTLPRSRVEIYHAMTQTLLETWNIWRSESRYDAGGQVLTPAQLRRALGKVALWSRREKPGGILRRRELERQFVAALRELQIETNDVEQTAQSYLSAAVEQAGLIEERAPGIFAFWHPTFEEFLAASEVATPPDQALEKLLPLRADPYWREVILLAVGLVGVVGDDRAAASALVRDLVRTNPPIHEPLLHPALRLGAACITDNPTLERDLIQEVLLELAQSLIQQPYEQMAGAFVELTDVLPTFKPGPLLIEALGELAPLNHNLGTIRTAAYRLLSNVAASDERARQLCLQKCERGLDQDFPFKDVMARFYATLGCVRAGLSPVFALTNLTGTDQGIFHIERAAEMLDLDERAPTKDAVQRGKNLQSVYSVLNQPVVWPTPVSSGPLPEQEVSVVMEPLAAALLLSFAGDRSSKVCEIFEEALKPKYDASGAVFDAAHAPLLFDFGDEAATIELQRLALVAFRRWFKHQTPERRLHAANETLRFLESWEEMYVLYIEQAPEFEGHVEEAKREKFVEAYIVDRQTLREEAIDCLKSCLHVPNPQTRLLAADFLLRREQVTPVARAIEKWVGTDANAFVNVPLGQLVTQMGEMAQGEPIVSEWMRANTDPLRFIAASALLAHAHHREEAFKVMEDCLDSPLVEVRSSTGAILGVLSSFAEGKPLSPKVEAALRSCLGSDEGDASRNAAGILYQSGFREEALLPYLANYLNADEVEQRFDTLRALQEHDAEMAILGPYIAKLGQQNPTARAAFEKVQNGQILTEQDVKALKAFIDWQPSEIPENYFYRRCFYDWLWFNLEANNRKM